MTSKLDVALVDRAVNALFKYEAKKTQSAEKVKLIDGFAKPILAQIQLTKSVAKSVLKPVRVKIPNSMFSPEDEEHSICLFCRSEDKAQVEEYLEKNKFNGLTKVLSINDVKKYYNAHKDKKKLLNEHTHFACDARVVRQLYNLLGNVFGARNNYPVPVDIEKLDKIHSSVQKVIDSTYMALAGANISIRFGHTAMNQQHVIENIIEGLNFAVQKFKGEWKDIHNIHLKTSDSAALPIYSKVPDEMLNFVATKAGTAPAPAVKGAKAAATKKGKEATAPVSTTTSSAKTPVKAAAAAKVATPAPTPAAATFEVSPQATAVKKRKAEETVAATEATTTPAAKSVNKKGKTTATKAAAPAVVVEVEEEAPVVTTAKKATKKAAVAVAAAEEEAETTTPAAMRSHKKKPAAAAVKEVEVVAPTRRSARSK